MVRNNARICERTSFKNFLQTSNLSSLKYLRENRKGCLHIYFWVCENVIQLGIGVILGAVLYEAFNENLTVTTLEDTNYPVDNVPFPAISICNVNKISKAKAEMVTHFISETTGTPLEFVADYMKGLGSLYDHDDTSTYKLIDFQKVMEKFSHVEEFEPVKLMKWLTPSCEEFLVSCKWKNEEVNCSEIFQMRLTFEGFCCIFNYVKTTIEKIEERFLHREILFGSYGLEFGLTVELNNQLDDYFYAKQASLGANVHIFDPRDFPDRNSGTLSEQLVGFHTEFFMHIQTTKFESVPDVLHYPAYKRDCYFPHERNTYFGVYSSSDCNLECRMKSMEALCGCVPFMIPQNRSLVCDLADIHCLSKYRTKWDSFAPAGAKYDSNLLREMHYSLNCEDRCLSSCDSYTYEVLTNPVPMTDTADGNNSILHIYYGNRYSNVYRQEVYYHWYEILSKTGTIFTLIIGFSIITIAEMIVFCAYKIHKYFKETTIFDDDFCASYVWNF